MKRIFLLTTLGTLLTLNAYGQSADLASAIGNSTPTPEKERIEEQKSEQIADDRGAFSFLNFSFIKKPLNFFSGKDQSSETTEESPAETTKEPESKETPLQKITRLADLGDVDAELSLGYMYLYGQNGVETDYNKALHYYSLAADQNNTIALNNLGSLYFNGIGTEPDYPKAASLFLKAAQNGSDDAAVNLAFIYLSARQKENNENAVVLLKQAADAGNNTAKFMLGYAYYKGFVVEKDLIKAVDYMKQATEAHLDEAEYVLAEMYANGEGIAKNYGNAVRHYKSAASQGHVASMMRLADILSAGKMYPKNIGQAHIYYNVASVYGASDAAQKRDALEPALKIEELLQAQATAETFKEAPSELTSYVRQTFGKDIKRYIDNNITK